MSSFREKTKAGARLVELAPVAQASLGRVMAVRTQRTRRQGFQTRSSPIWAIGTTNSKKNRSTAMKVGKLMTKLGRETMRLASSADEKNALVEELGRRLEKRAQLEKDPAHARCSPIALMRR